jgi:hypothetical protein
MAFDIKPGDLTYDVFKTIQVSGRLDPTKEQFHFSGGAFSILRDAINKNPYITNLIEIKVGAQEATGWSIGFIQAAEIKNIFLSYSGKSYLLGSVAINLAPEGEFNCPDYFGDIDIVVDPSLREQIPWTKKAAERFRYDAKTGIVKCNTSDGPGGHVPAKVSNQTTNVDNFLRAVIDHRRYCCALVLEETKSPPTPRRVISHQIWDLKLALELKWRNGIPEATTTSSQLIVGDFVYGAPVDPAFVKVADPNYLKGKPRNQVLFERLSSALKGKAPMFRTDTDTTTAGENFFK